MVLSDLSITRRIEDGSIVIAPLDPQDIQPASVDLHLAPNIKVFRTCGPGAVIDVAADNDHLLVPQEIPEGQPYLLQPGTFALASTAERFAVPDDLVARLDGKSSLGRLGLLVHATAGYIDPGFRGDITLELSNATGIPITLYRNMRIAQLSFMDLTTPALRPYGSPGLGSKYQDQRETTSSRMNRDFTANAARTTS